MSNKKTEMLVEKYLEAESNLIEEQEIFNAESANSELDPWFNMVKKSRTKAPENLNDSVWKAIQTKTKRSRRIIYGMVAAAASVALIIALSINNSTQTEKEKDALLSQALSMFDDNEPKSVEQNIIYEDELIVIYIAQK